MGKRGTDYADAVKQQAHGRWREVLRVVGGIDDERLDGKPHPCPKCGGTDRFRLIDQDAGAVLCNQCFRAKNGDGISAVRWMLGVGFREACEAIAGHLGVELPRNGKAGGAKKRKPDADEKLEWLPWNSTLVGLWCALRSIRPEVIQSVGGRCALYYRQYVVLALPMLGSLDDADSEPVGWIVERLPSGTLPVFGDGVVTGAAKRKVTYGSRPGLICGPRIKAASVIWKTEGPTDLLALLSLADFPDSHSACCNGYGAGENPAKVPCVRDVFRAEATAYIVHDCDTPGQEGATYHVSASGAKTPGWAPSIASLVADCRNVVLPFDVEPTKGKDLRDYIASGKSYADLLKLAAAATPVDGIAILSAAPLAVDDPNHLATINLRRYCEHAGCKPNQVPIRFWRGEWYKWRGNKYQKLGMCDFTARIQETIYEAFEREYHALQESDDPPEYQRKMTERHAKEAIHASKRLCLVPESTELNTWIAGDLREKRGYVALENGILDMDRLLSGEMQEGEQLLPHSPDWLSTFCLPYPFDPTADCPKWLAFLETVMQGDQQRIDLLQEWCGYLLTPSTDQQKFLLCYGEGSNGKSVFLSAVRAMLGSENCSSVALENFGNRFDKTSTLGKLANICSDAGAMETGAEGVIKSFTNGDMIQFDRKNKEPIECIPTARLMLACNNLPRWSDKSDGPWRRMIAVPFLAKIDPKKRVLGMDKSAWWQQAGELPGMLTWAITGLARLRANGWTESAACIDLIQAYREANNPAMTFLLETYQRASADCWIAKSVAYEAYREWCKANGHSPLSNLAFGREAVRVFSPGTLKKWSDGKRINVYTGLSELEQF